jgi:hypothetical protein
MDEITRNQIRHIAKLDKKRIIKESVEIDRLDPPEIKLTLAFGKLFEVIRNIKPLLEEKNGKELNSKLREIVIDKLSILATLVEEIFKEEENETDE